MRIRQSSRGAASVVVIGVDNNGMRLIRECLGTEAVLPTAATSFADAPQTVRKTRPNVVVIGMDGDAEQAVRLGQELSTEINGLHLVAISERTDPQRIRSAMRAGFREYVTLPEDAQLLRKAVKDSTWQGGDETDQGKVVAILGAKGGSGVTTLTVNLAADLSPVHRVCVVDLDFSMGDVASMLDLQPTSSIHDLLRNLNRLDERMLTGSVTVHPTKVHVLAQATELQEEQRFSSEDVLHVLTAAADAYQYVLVDCGGRVDPITNEVARAADRVILVCTPTVVGIKNAWRRLQFMEKIGVEKDSIRLIVNQWGKNAELTLQDIESNLGTKVAATISDEPTICHKATNMGRVLRDVDKKSLALRDISAAVEIITEGVEQVRATPAARPFWGLFR